MYVLLTSWLHSLVQIEQSGRAAFESRVVVRQAVYLSSQGLFPAKVSLLCFLTCRHSWLFGIVLRIQRLLRRRIEYRRLKILLLPVFVVIVFKSGTFVDFG